MKTSEKFLNTLKTMTSVPVVMLDKLHMIKGLILYKTKTGLSFIARAGTSDVDEIIVICSGYAYPLYFLPKIKNPTIVDLGGYIGEFSLYAHHFLNRKCSIYAYEPSKENFHYLVLNTALNESVVTLFNQGIHVYKGKGYVQHEGISSDQFTVTSKKEQDNDEECDVVTFKNILKRNNIKTLDILKIDIEGMEHTLLEDKTTMDLLKKNVRYLFIECHELSPKKSSTTLLRALLPYFKVLTKRDHVFLLENKSNETK